MSPLKSLKRIQPGVTSEKGKTLFFALNLTTLIDAFCILVIFLLSNMNGQLKNLEISKSLVLPSAAKTASLDDGIVVRIEQNNIFMNNQIVTKEQIAEALLKAKKMETASLVIQADRNSDYENIGLVLRAGGQAGYEKYVFAVLPGT
jgi:biopolymer transport protein ExbD